MPLFIGLVQAGVPLGVTFSCRISAPMVNAAALTLLFGMFGRKVPLLYLGLGLSVAIVAAWIMGRLKMAAHLQDWVRDMMGCGVMRTPGVVIDGKLLAAVSALLVRERRMV